MLFLLSVAHKHGSEHNKIETCDQIQGPLSGLEVKILL